jgi:hypothetical protein
MYTLTIVPKKEDCFFGLEDTIKIGRIVFSGFQKEERKTRRKKYTQLL